MKSTPAALVDLVLPRRCMVCAEPGSALCDGCTGVAKPFGVQVRGVAPVVAVAEYGGALRTALVAYKDRNRRDLAVRLGGLLACALSTLTGEPRFALVPVPSSPTAVRRRGGDHVLRLARIGAARVTVSSAGSVADPPPIEVVRALRLLRATEDSAGLDVRQRAANVSGAMTADAPRVDVPVVIIDDIVTTGATLAEAARALSVAGWRIRGAAVVAATPRHGSWDGSVVPVGLA